MATITPPISLPKLLTVKQVAHHLQVNPRQVYRYIKAGKLRVTKFCGSTRVAENDLAMFIASGGN
jgi:excisionase family DNA binding protein